MGNERLEREPEEPVADDRLADDIERMKDNVAVTPAAETPDPNKIYLRAAIYTDVLELRFRTTLTPEQVWDLEVEEKTGDPWVCAPCVRTIIDDETGAESGIVEDIWIRVDRIVAIAEYKN